MRDSLGANYRRLLPYVLSWVRKGGYGSAYYSVADRDYHTPTGNDTRLLIKLTRAQRAKLGLTTDGGKDVWLYNDGSKPEDSPANMAAYLDKLAVIMPALMKVEPRVGAPCGCVTRLGHPMGRCASHGERRNW